MNKKKRLSTWIVVIVLLIIGSNLIWFDNPFIHLPTKENKLFASLLLLGICLGGLLFDDLIARVWKAVISSEFSQILRIRFGFKSNKKQPDPQSESQHILRVKDLSLALRQTYGRFWPRKVRILLLTGSAADVEQLAPNLTSQYWQEDSGTVLLWGGDLGASADSAWLSALRKLRHRPLDGVVWVTSALAARTTLGQNEANTSLSVDMMDSVAQAFSSRYELLGWQLPLYVWSLHNVEGAQAGRVTQSVGCLLPAGCKPDELSSQLSSMVPECPF